MRKPSRCQNYPVTAPSAAHIQGAAGFGCGSRRPPLLRCGHRSRQQVAGGGGPMPATQQAPQQFVDSADGVRIAVYEEGNPEGPTVVLVHGFPDSHVLWDGVVPLLARAVPDHPLRQPRCRAVVGAQTRLGVHDGPVRRRLRRGDRRAEPRAAGARAGPRLGLGGRVGVPDPARRRRPGRLVHVGVRPELRTSWSITSSAVCGGRGVRGSFSRAISQALRLTYMAVLLDSGAGAAAAPAGAVGARRCGATSVDNIPVDQIHHSEQPGQRRRAFGEECTPPTTFARSRPSSAARTCTSSTCRCS